MCTRVYVVAYGLSPISRIQRNRKPVRQRGAGRIGRAAKDAIIPINQAAAQIPHNYARRTERQRRDTHGRTSSETHTLLFMCAHKNVSHPVYSRIYTIIYTRIYRSVCDFIRSWCAADGSCNYIYIYRPARAACIQCQQPADIQYMRFVRSSMRVWCARARLSEIARSLAHRKLVELETHRELCYSWWRTNTHKYDYIY